MTETEYIFTLQIIHRYENSRGSSPSCRKCGKRLRSGEHVVSKRVKRGLGYYANALYHKECWDSLFIEVAS